jgi:phosphoribosylglycinamide formyltransferase-1
VSTPVRTAILVSGRGSNMAALIKAAAAPSFPADIALVLSNRPDAGALGRAHEAGIATAVVDHTAFAGRDAFEDALDGVLRAHRVELVCLAGFMRVLTGDFVGRWQGRMINIHPSLLPSFRGLHTHERALAEGVKVHGCTVHFVVPELDAGPIIVQAAVPVHAADTADTLAARVLEAEHVAYPMALRLVASGHARLEEGRCVAETDDAQGRLVSPADGAD